MVPMHCVGLHSEKILRVAERKLSVIRGEGKQHPMFIFDFMNIYF